MTKQLLISSGVLQPHFYLEAHNYGNVIII